MGKTTFLINLFLTYTNQPLKNLFGWSAKQNMKLFPLGSPDIWTDIEKIENKRDTILLLDAFDEDVKAVDDYGARMEEILEKTKEFKEIVITCRTQFFPSDQEIPDDTGYTTFGGEQETHRFQRVYLSVFDESDIKKYLKKRFSILRRSKRKRAFEIVKKSPNLVMRPMLLSYINDFVEADRTFNYTYEIYEVLIDKWIERESRKYGIRQRYGSEEKYRELLLNFSQTLAKNLYEKRDERGGYFISKDDFIKDATDLQISDVDDYGMTETEVRSKSLLNRNAEGKYKFSHKSIFEYFLAKELIQNGKFLSTFDFDGMSAAEMFLDEMIAPFRKLYGAYAISTLQSHLIPLRQLTTQNLTNVKKLKIRQVEDFNLLNLSLFANIEELIIFDKQKYNLLYDLYVVYWNWKNQGQWLEQRELRERLERLERLELHDWQKLQEQLELKKWQNMQQLAKALELRNLLEPSLNKNDNENIKMLQPIEDFLKDMKLLEEKLPNCRIIY